MMSIEKYLKEYEECLREVSKETCEKYREKTWMLFEFINNWIDLVPRHEEVSKQAIHSLSGIILLHSWKLTNWITYEILCGKYFEAIRNLRFIFEGTVYAVIIEDAIESRVSEKRGGLSEVGLKKEIFELWEMCKGKRVYEKRRIMSIKLRESLLHLLIKEWILRKLRKQRSISKFIPKFFPIKDFICQQAKW